jgi:hypothetical protein
MVAMPSRLLGRGARVAASWSAEERDAVLYAASALFAIATVQWSSIALYQQWGRLAVGPYALGAVASAVAARRARHRTTAAAAGVPTSASSPTWHWTTSRTVIFLVVFVGATLGPLALEVLWQTQDGGTSHVQPEARVVEQSGSNLRHGKPLYNNVDAEHRPPVVGAGQPEYDAYNPYLPLMSLFGLPSSTKAPRRLTDARVAFSLITILVVVAALALCRGPTGPRVLSLQAMTVFPTAALPLATGGDDLPIAAFLFLGLILLQRRRPLAAGIVLGLAASMKITAWPLAALAFLVATDRDGHRGRRPSLFVVAGLAVVMLPSILPTFVGNPAAFIDNVVRFPLGLAGITSPALHRGGGGRRRRGPPDHPRPPHAAHGRRFVPTARLGRDHRHLGGPGHPHRLPALSRRLLHLGLAVAQRSHGFDAARCGSTRRDGATPSDRAGACARGTGGRHPPLRADGPAGVGSGRRQLSVTANSRMVKGVVPVAVVADPVALPANVVGATVTPISHS